jgi:hypothetical protein
VGGTVKIATLITAATQFSELMYYYVHNCQIINDLSQFTLISTIIRE